MIKELTLQLQTALNETREDNKKGLKSEVIIEEYGDIREYRLVYNNINIEDYEEIKNNLKHYDLIEIPFDPKLMDMLSKYFNNEYQGSYNDQRELMNGYNITIWTENNRIYYEW